MSFWQRCRTKSLTLISSLRSFTSAFPSRATPARSRSNPKIKTRRNPRHERVNEFHPRPHVCLRPGADDHYGPSGKRGSTVSSSLWSSRCWSVGNRNDLDHEHGTRSLVAGLVYHRQGKKTHSLSDCHGNAGEHGRRPWRRDRQRFE